MDRRHAVIEEIHCHLGHIVLLDKPAHALHRREAPRLILTAASLPQIEGNAVGLIGRAEDIDVVGNEKIPRPGGGDAPVGHKLRRAVIGPPLRVFEPLGEAFVLTLAQIRQVAAIVLGRCRLVEIERHPQFLRRPLRKFL